jgi:S-adenosylmethionine uptake transporter
VTNSPLAILLISQAALALASSTFCLFSNWHMPSGTHLLYVAFAGICSMVGHLLMIASIRSAELSAVAPFRYASIIWAITLGWLVWRQFPDMISLAGICIVITAGLYTFYREQHLKRQRRQPQQRPAP